MEGLEAPTRVIRGLGWTGDPIWLGKIDPVSGKPRLHWLDALRFRSVRRPRPKIRRVFLQLPCRGKELCDCLPKHTNGSAGLALPPRAVSLVERYLRLP